MSTTHTAPGPRPAPTTPPVYAWWCARCRREALFGADELARFAREGWPVCCGERVYCYAPVERSK